MSFSPFHFGSIRLDPLSSYGLAFSDYCMTVENCGDHFEHASASFGVSHGVWYWEVQPLTDHLMQIGVIVQVDHEYIDFGDRKKGQGVGDLALSWSVDLFRRLTFSQGVTCALQIRDFVIFGISDDNSFTQERAGAENAENQTWVHDWNDVEY
jgi:hypothetical protein